MQNTTQYAPCPNCGQSNAKKVSFTWWGGALGPSLITHVKCQNCGAEYNGKSGKSNQQGIIIYILVTFFVAFCLCGGLTLFGILLNNQ